jgi:hypothetical protein
MAETTINAAQPKRPAKIGWPLPLGSNHSRRVAYAAIDYLACAASGGLTTLPPDAKERFRGRAVAKKVSLAREEATRAATASYHVAAAMAAAMTAATKVARRFAAANCRGFAAASYRATAADRIGGSPEAAPVEKAVRVARPAGEQVDHTVAARHRIAFRCAKAVRYAADWRFHWRVRPCVRKGCGLRLSDAAAALRRGQPF